MKLTQALVFVSDVEKMQAFYEQGFGLKVKDGAAADGFVRLHDPKAKGGAVLALHKLRGPASDGTPRTDAVTKLCFEAKDAAAVKAAATRLKKAGAKMRAPKSFDTITFCDGIDPEGNVFQVTTRQ